MKNTTETVLRTLNLPPEYAFVDGFITDYSVKKNLVIVKNVDRARSVKTVSSTGRVTYSNAPDSYSYNITESRNEQINSGTYLPNLLSMLLNKPKIYLNPEDVYEIKKDRIDPTSTGGWIAASTSRITQISDNLILLSSVNELGGSENVIARKFVKRVDGENIYKNPVDYLGREIVGDMIDNQGASPTAMTIPFSNRIVSVAMTTITSQGTGTFTSSTGKWSGGIKTMTNTSNVLVPVADLPALFGKSIEELEFETRTEIYCTPLNRSTHITSTSTEILVTGNQYKGVTYYSGVDASVSKPSGKITSYNKSYPGHVQRWILKQWNQDGSVVGNGNVGQVWMLQLSSSEDSSISVVAGNETRYDANTKTLTYDNSKISELWYTFEEIPAQFKNWGGETILKLN